MTTYRGTKGTKPPTGLSLTRNGNKFVLTWKIADKDYGAGQQYATKKYYLTADGTLKETAWTSQSVTNTQTKESTTITLSDYYPTTNKKLRIVQARVRGRRNKYLKTGSFTDYIQEDWSAWSNASFQLEPPRKPSVSVALDSVLWNKATFSWSYTDSNPLHRPFADLQYQSILVKDCTETDGSKLTWSTANVDWRSGTTGTSGSITITENTALISGKSYTRWVRVRARGASGPGDWVYRKHVYAYPNKAVIETATAKETASGTNIYVKWTAVANAARPIDSTTVQYLSVVPLANLVCPSGQTWTDALVQGDTSNADAASFTKSITVSEDECLYVRVNTQHDDQLITEGTPKLVKYGNLADPENLTVSYNAVTYQATITADNRSSVPDSFLAVRYTTEDNPTGFIVGIIPHGQTTTGTIQCPAYSGTIDFGVYAVQGTYTLKTRADGVTQYVIKANMKSDIIWDGGSIPAAPTLSAERAESSGMVRLTWDWSWLEATGAEISWSDHENAWESTDEPDRYQVTSIHTSQWYVADLEEGRVWYFRIRLYKDETYGTYSDIVSVNLSSAPLIPSLELSQQIIPEDGTITASWTYVSTDGTRQALAEVCEATLSGGVWVYGAPIAVTETAQHVSISAEENGWTAGQIVLLAVRTVSGSGQQSAYSDPVPVTIAETLSISVTTDLTTVTLDGDSVNGLTALPLTVTVSGATEDSTISVAVERLLSYFMDRPDETQFNGYAGETIALVSPAASTTEIDRETLFGSFDDGAWYKLIVSVEDGYGQSVTDETEFMVQWSHQAEAPTATILIDKDDRSASITVDTPAGAVAGDTADIYRLSADRPELIYPDADYATTYVDPYPTIGEFGGYRIVMKTKDGDYIDANNEPAWTDYYIPLSVPFSIIDFGGETIEVLLNQNISNGWDKDFKETQYLGGSVQGDWNKAVSRTGSVSTYMIRATDGEMIRSLRRLAAYTGICHVRTIDGSSYAADVQVSEDYGYDNFATGFTLKITRVDTEGYDGILLSDWEVSA